MKVGYSFYAAAITEPKATEESSERAGVTVESCLQASDVGTGAHNHPEQSQRLCRRYTSHHKHDPQTETEMDSKGDGPDRG